jgi:hypothetical protein
MRLRGQGKLAESELTTRFDHDAIKWNRIMISSLCLSMIFSENRFPLCANAALRVRIMLQPPMKKTPAVNSEITRMELFRFRKRREAHENHAK